MKSDPDKFIPIDERPVSSEDIAKLKEAHRLLKSGHQILSGIDLPPKFNPMYMLADYKTDIDRAIRFIEEALYKLEK